MLPIDMAAVSKHVATVVHPACHRGTTLFGAICSFALARRPVRCAGVGRMYTAVMAGLRVRLRQVWTARRSILPVAHPVLHKCP